MALPVTTGEVALDVPGAGKPCKTWYTVFGTLNTGVCPLVCLHGGPGGPHDYLLPIKELWATHGIPVVMYDQLGNGRSTRLPEKKGDGKFWTTGLFISELENLLAHLKIQDRYDLLGHSWGAMFGSEFAARRPQGLQKLILMNGPASMPLWSQSATKLRSQLPPNVQETLQRHEESGTIDSQEYQDAVTVYYERHLCKKLPWPQELVRFFESIGEDDTVYLTMNGPNEFSNTGSLRSWSVIDDAHKIAAPTLVINGKYDAAQDETVEPFVKSVPNVKWEHFTESSHMPQFEEPERLLQVLGSFLAGE